MSESITLTKPPEEIIWAGHRYRLADEPAVARAFAAASATKLACGGNWTVEELALAHGERPATIRRRCRSGQIKTVRQRPYLITGAEAARFLKEGPR